MVVDPQPSLTWEPGVVLLAVCSVRNLASWRARTPVDLSTLDDGRPSTFNSPRSTLECAKVCKYEIGKNNQRDALPNLDTRCGAGACRGRALRVWGIGLISSCSGNASLAAARQDLTIVPIFELLEYVHQFLIGTVLYITAPGFLPAIHKRGAGTGPMRRALRTWRRTWWVL